MSRRVGAVRRRSCKQDPAVETVVAYVGGGGGAAPELGAHDRHPQGPLGAQRSSADQVIARLRGKLARLPGATLYLQAVQDLRVGGRRSNAQYQYTLQGDNVERAERLGAAGLRQAAHDRGSWPTSTAISRRTGCRPRWSSIATPRRAWASRRR